MDFSLPQNRQRIVITGTRNEDRGFRLATLEEVHSLKAAQLDRLGDENRWRNIVDHDAAFPNWSVAQGDKFFSADLAFFAEKSPGKFLRDILEKKVHESFDLTKITNQWIDKNKPVNKFVGGVEILSNQDGGARMGYTIFGTNGIAPTLTSSTSRHYERYKINEAYRRLTPTEYARIQRFPDAHCSSVSDRIQYILYCNAVSPQLVGWAMQKLLSKNPVAVSSVKSSLPQLSLPFKNSAAGYA